MLMPILFAFLIGVAVALIRRRTPSADAPARLLAWSVGLLPAERRDWGRAMTGELDRLDGRVERWRFALGCAAAAVVMPPWGRAAAALCVLTAIAVGGAGLAVYTHVHYRLHTDGWTWVSAAVLLLVLTGYVLGGSVLLRRPGVAGPGLTGGALVAVAWLAISGFTFHRSLTGLRGHLSLVLLAAIVVGLVGTRWGGGAAAGRRAARLAGVTAGLGVFLYGVLAVAILGATGHDPSDGWTPAQVVDDNLGNQAVLYLIALPLVTATVGWAAAAATARVRRTPAVIPVDRD